MPFEQNSTISVHTSKMITKLVWMVLAELSRVPGADLGGGSRGSGPPLSYMKNDVIRTVICAAFCMFPSLDLQHCPSF